MKENLQLEERFRPYLLNRDYTFVGPSDPQALEAFIKDTNLIAPVMGWHRNIHDVLNHRESINLVQRNYTNLPSRVYVIIRPEDEAFPVLIHATIEEYCKRNNINFN